MEEENQWHDKKMEGPEDEKDEETDEEEEEEEEEEEDEEEGERGEVMSSGFVAFSGVGIVGVMQPRLSISCPNCALGRSFERWKRADSRGRSRPGPSLNPVWSSRPQWPFSDEEGALSRLIDRVGHSPVGG